MTLIHFPELTSPEAGRLAADGRAIGLLVLGAVEQHGPHLPLATDAIIAEHLAAAVAERISEPVVVAPVLPGGLSTHHLAFPGTVHLPEEVVRGFVVAYVEAFGRIGVTDVAIFSSHGGNFALIGEIARSYAEAGGEARVIAYDDLPRYLQVMARASADAGLVVPETDAHAGGLETSQMLYLRGEDTITVPDGLEGYVEAEEGWLDVLLNEGIHALSPIGVLGRPAGATAAVGEAICAALAGEMASWIGAELGATPVAGGPEQVASAGPSS
jgi:creatinine amidohydrolase